jgi:putative cell wall-binding protein
MNKTKQIFDIKKTGKGIRSRSLLLITLTTGLLTLAACASTPKPPTQALQAAELAITNAETNRVQDYASSELNEARQNLAAANSAVQMKEMELAQRLAEQSRANADLASARTEMLKAKAVNDEMQKSIDTLKQEMQRNTGVL